MRWARSQASKSAWASKSLQWLKICWRPGVARWTSVCSRSSAVPSKSAMKARRSGSVAGNCGAICCRSGSEGSSRMMKRATWIVWMRPKGSRALAGSAVPGAAFIVSSKSASGSAAPVRTGAAMKIWDWPATATDLPRNASAKSKETVSQKTLSRWKLGAIRWLLSRMREARIEVLE
ncbi:hypothetical protein F5882DRAFT_188310 [Hyaloscypha sp. PMI_1271]|nr:hypothetical protein F5882DRAFT_188310 [Hyaloscypha sp. PMI_1271]